MSAMRPSMIALVSTSVANPIAAASAPDSATACTPTRRRMPRYFLAAVNANRYPTTRNSGRITHLPMYGSVWTGNHNSADTSSPTSKPIAATVNSPALRVWAARSTLLNPRTRPLPTSPPTIHPTANTKRTTTAKTG